MNLLRMYVGCLGVWALLMGISIAQESTERQPATSAAVRLKEVQLGTIRPLNRFGDIYLAGQPKAEEMAMLRSQGIKTIINLRLANEIAWDEAAVVNQAGMKYVHVPFQSPSQLKAEVFDKVLKTLRDKRRGPTVFHCASSNRVGAIWYAYRVLDGNLSYDAARKEAQQVGLRTPAYLEKAQEYVEAVQAKRELKKLPAVKP